MPGPPPRPYIVKKREGNPGHQKLNAGPPYRGGFGSAPSWIGSHGRKLWKQLVPELEKQGLGASVYRSALIGLCSNWQKVVTAETLLHKEGYTYEIKRDVNGVLVTTYIAQRPEVAIAFKGWDKVKAFGALFGFSPADVQKVVVGQPEEESLRKELMGGHGG